MPDDDDILFGEYSPDNETFEMSSAPDPDAAEPDQEDVEQESGGQDPELLQRISDLEERLAQLERYDTRRDPFPRIYLADSLGQEQTVDGGAIVPFTDGRAHPDSITATAGDVLMIEFQDVTNGEMARVAFAGGSGGGDLIPVTCSSPSGSAGTSSAACAFTYKVSTYGTTDGAYGASGVSPVMQRSTKGKMVAAAVGIWSVSNSVLIWCDEVPDRGCGTACT